MKVTPCAFFYVFSYPNIAGSRCLTEHFADSFFFVRFPGFSSSLSRSLLHHCPLSPSPTHHLSCSSQCPSFGAHTDPGTRYGTLNQDCFFMDRLQHPNGSYITVIGVFDGTSDAIKERNGRSRPLLGPKAGLKNKSNTKRVKKKLNSLKMGLNLS